MIHEKVLCVAEAVIPKFILLVCLTVPAALGETDAAGKWTLVAGRNVEYRVTNPARNTCQIEVKDADDSIKKQLVVHSRYYAHKSRKDTLSEQTDQIALGGGEAALIYIPGCESVVSFFVEGNESKN